MSSQRDLAPYQSSAGMSSLHVRTRTRLPCKARTDERILDPDGYKQRLEQMWRSRAPKYDFQNDFHPPLCEQLVSLADLGPSTTKVLDVASGTGFVALAAARALGPDGVVVANDISEPMLTQVGFSATHILLHVACDP